MMNTNSSLRRTTLWPFAAAALVALATAAAIWVLAPAAAWSACLVLGGAALAALAQWLSRQALHRRLGGDWDDFERLGGDDSRHRSAPEGSLISILGAKLLHRRENEAAVKGDVAAIAMGVGKLSAQTTQLALSLQIQGNTNRESRDSVHQIDRSIQVVAALARETEGDARQVSDLSLEGEERVNQAAGRMQSIAGAVRQSSEQVGQLVEGVEQIGGIANIIKEIAGQTNLLALNAAIEAARAGEQGRGFAVVADEVRKLAERTTKATGEIGALIERIQADTQAAVEQMGQVTPIIEGGLEQAESAATVLRGIKQQAAGTLEKMGNLSHALTEQSVQVTEMVNRVEQMVQVSETTEGMIREASNDSAALENDVLSLQGRVGVAAGAGADGGAVKPLLTWTEALATGYAEIDEQHRQLIALGNRLNEAIRSGQGRQAAGSVLDELIDYTVNHFKFEEGLMDKYAYAAAEDHKGKHRKLVQDVLARKARFDAGEALSSELMNFIRDWLVDHIMKTDKLLGRALLAAR